MEAVSDKREARAWRAGERAERASDHCKDIERRTGVVRSHDPSNGSIAGPVHILHIDLQGGHGRACCPRARSRQGVAFVQRLWGCSSRRVRVWSIPAMAGRGGFWAGQALLGVWVVTEYMPAIGEAGRPAGGMRIPGDHVAQHVYFAPAVAFAPVGCRGRVSGYVRQQGFVGVVEWDSRGVWESMGEQLDRDMDVDLPDICQDSKGRQ